MPSASPPDPAQACVSVLGRVARLSKMSSTTNILVLFRLAKLGLSMKSSTGSSGRTNMWNRLPRYLSDTAIQPASWAEPK